MPTTVISRRVLRNPVSGRRSPSLDRNVVLLTFLLMPATFFQGTIGGFRATGIAWLIVLLIGAFSLLLWPLPHRAMRYLVPYASYLLFGVMTLLWAPDLIQGSQTIAQLATVAVVYLVAWRAFSADPQLIYTLRRMAGWLLPTAMLLFGQALVSTGGFTTVGARPAAMSTALLFVLATYERSPRVTLLVGAVVLGYNLAAGSRMGSAVIALLILLSPSLRLSWRGRLAVAAAGTTLLLVLVPTPAFQERWFVGRGEGTVTDIITLNDNFNTAGRGENWPAVLERCDERPLLGFGFGAAGIITNEINSKANHPHNEYIRTYCDGGLISAPFFWLFFVLVSARSLGRRSPEGRSVSVAAAALVLALLLFSATDNITIYTIQFMAPAAVVFAASDRLFARRHVLQSSP